MRTCVINLGIQNSYSVIVDDSLVIHKIITNFSEIINLLYKQNIDRLSIFCQGTPVRTKTTDSFKLSSLNLSGEDIPIVIRDRDQLFLTEVANLLFIDDVRIYSYTDYIEYKFRDSGDVIVVSPYLNDFAVFYLKDNKIANFSKVSLVNLPRKIGKFKDLYKCPVANIYNKTDLIGIGSVLANYKEVPDDKLWTLDYLPFVMNTEGQTLKENSHDLDFINEADVKKEEKIDSPIEQEQVDDDINSSLDDDELEEMLENTKSNLNEYNKENSRFKFSDVMKSNKNEDDDLDGKTTLSDTLITCAIAVFLLLGIFGIITSIVYSDKITKLTESITLEQSKQSSTSDMKAYLDGDLTKSPFMQTYLCKSQLSDLKLSNISYDNGNLSATVLYTNESELNSSEDKIKQFYDIKDKGYLGKYQDAGIDYEKTKYILTSRST